MSKGRIIAIAFVLVSIAFTASRFIGHSAPASGSFPGVGSESDWKDARAIAHESANATRAGNWEQAIALGQQAIAKYPNDADFYNNTGYAMLRRGAADDFTQSEQMFKKAIELRPDTALYWDNLGRALCGEQQYPQGREAFAKALQLNPPPEEAAEIQQNIQQIDMTAPPGAPAR